jgi:hypothetical protein
VVVIHMQVLPRFRRPPADRTAAALLREQLVELVGRQTNAFSR